MSRARRRLRFAALLVAAPCGGLLLAERWFDVRHPYPLQRLEALERSVVCTAADGSWLQVWPTTAGERVLATRWDQLSPVLRAAVLTAEDAGFFGHSGVDPSAVARAAIQNVTAGRVVSGASTLTMQVVRIVEPRPRTLRSKLVEAFRARQLERLVGKRRILDTWLTQVPIGGTLRGLQSAARHWFGRDAAELAAHEAAMLVAMVPAPSFRSPLRRPEFLRARRDELLRRMAAAGHLTAAEARAARARPLGARPRGWPQHAWHLCATRIAELPRTGPRPEEIATGLDVVLQGRLEQLVGARRQLPGDGCAVVVLDRDDGRVRSLIADRQVAPGQLDLTRCRRSVGSTLKPFLFALARELGCLRDDALLDDRPLHFADWRPANFDGSWQGRLHATDALATSANLPAVRCLQQVGVPAFRRLLETLGLPVPAAGLHLDAALGTLAASPLELAHAWRRFVAEPARCDLSESSLRWTLASLSRLAPGGATTVPGRVAWKSGTSSGHRDAWCVGVTEGEVIVVWVGNRSGRGSTDLTGTRLAAGLLGDVVARL